MWILAVFRTEEQTFIFFLKRDSQLFDSALSSLDTIEHVHEI